jgi:hypothetical protein
VFTPQIIKSLHPLAEFTTPKSLTDFESSKAPVVSRYQFERGNIPLSRRSLTTCEGTGKYQLSLTQLEIGWYLPGWRVVVDVTDVTSFF